MLAFGHLSTRVQIHPAPRPLPPADPHGVYVCVLFALLYLCDDARSLDAWGAFFCLSCWSSWAGLMSALSPVGVPEREHGLQSSMKDRTALCLSSRQVVLFPRYSINRKAQHVLGMFRVCFLNLVPSGILNSRPVLPKCSILQVSPVCSRRRCRLSGTSGTMRSRVSPTSRGTMSCCSLTASTRCGWWAGTCLSVRVCVLLYACMHAFAQFPLGAGVAERRRVSVGASGGPKDTLTETRE